MNSLGLKAIFAFIAMTFSQLEFAQEAVQYRRIEYPQGWVDVHVVIIDRNAPNYELRVLARTSGDNDLLSTDLKSLAATSPAPVIAAINGYTWVGNDGVRANQIVQPNSSLILNHRIVRDCFSENPVECYVDKRVITFNGQSNGIIDINGVQGASFDGESYYAIGSDWEILRNGAL